MSAIRNSCVARGKVNLGTNTVVYTVPNGFVLLLKSVRVATFQTNNWSTVFYVQTPDRATIVFLAQLLSATVPFFNWDGWIALNGGDQLTIQMGVDDGLYWVSGALLPFTP